MNATPTLQGFGVALVPLALHHLPALQHTHDASTWQWMSESGATPELLRSFVERALALADAGSARVWATTLCDRELPPEQHGSKENGNASVVGCTRLADLNLHHRTGEIGWTWVAPHLRGTGLNARVKFLQLQHCFEELQLRRVALKTHHSNLRSQRAMLKIGAQYEGTFRNHLLMPDGSSRDTRWYSIIDTDWAAVRALLLDRIARELPLPCPPSFVAS